MNTQKFIERSKKVHGDKYDYSKVEYINCNTKVIIICKIHGEFIQLAGNHYRGHGCSNCAFENISDSCRFSQKEVIKKFQEIHGNLYNYSKVEYKNSKTKVCIICPIHGEFYKSYENHVKGQGCKKCSSIEKGNKIRKINNLDKLKNKFKDLDFSEFIYKTGREKSKVICRDCGVSFYDSFTAMNMRETGCLYCNEATKRRRYTKETLIERFNEVHNSFYNYPNLQIKKQLEKIEIICPKHGLFSMPTNDHLNGRGCLKCYRERQKTMHLMPSEEFFNTCREVHNNFYDYTKSVYKGMMRDILIKCPLHGTFKQRAKHHYDGHGCKSCVESNGEKKVRETLDKYNISFEPQQTFEKCRNPKTNTKLKFDFYLKDLNTCIEYDGKQHYESVEYWGGEEGLEKLKYRDSIKNTFCKENDITLLRIPYTEYNDIEHILKNNIGIGTNLL